MELCYTVHYSEARFCAVGPLCEYKSNAEATAVLMKCDSDLSEYEGTLTSPDSKCGDDTTKNVFTWKPDENTPKLVYYQVRICVVCVCS